MANMTITSFQQYSLNRFRVNLNTNYTLDVIRNVKVSIYTEDGTDLTHMLQGISDSNDSFWDLSAKDDVPSASYFDIYLKDNAQLKAGTYRVTVFEPKSIYCEEKMVFDSKITINHMEDIRFTKVYVEQIALGQIVLDFIPKKVSEDDFTSKEIEKMIETGDTRIFTMEEMAAILEERKRIAAGTLVKEDNEKRIVRLYQTREAFDSMTMNIVNAGNLSYGDMFHPLSESKLLELPENSPYSGQLIVCLKKDGMLPKGLYNIRFVNVFKNRSDVLFEERGDHGMGSNIPYLTTLSPKLESAKLAQRTNPKKRTVLSISFDNPPESDVFKNATFMIVDTNTYTTLCEKYKNDPRGLTKALSEKDVSKVFKQESALQTESRAVTTHVMRVDLDFMNDSYTLDKGNYTIIWNWNSMFIPNQTISFDSGWMLHTATDVTMDHLKNVVIHLSKPVFKKFATTAKYKIELNGVSVDTLTDAEKDDIFGAFGMIGDATLALKDPSLKDDDPITELRIPIKDKTKLRLGEYSFIIYTPDNIKSEDEKATYHTLAQINIAESVSPVIKSVEHNIDEVTVTLEAPCPIDALEMSVPHLIDTFSNTDLSDKLDTISEANVWEEKVLSVETFTVRVSHNETIAEGEYGFFLNFLGKETKRFSIPIQYMSRREGHITKVEQVDLEHIKITFSQTQTREFLLQTKLRVTGITIKEDFTNRFVLLETVLKESGYAIDDITIRMDWEDSFPRGRYRIEFVQVVSENCINTVYSAEADLGHMTNNKPTIGLAVTDKIVDSRNVKAIQMMFTGYIEWELYQKANVTIKNSSGVEVMSKFLPKEKWEVETAEKQNIKFAKNIRAPLFDVDTKMSADTYTITFFWGGDITYIEDVTTSVFMDNVIPLIPESKMISPTRAYFEFQNAMQESWIRTLLVEVKDRFGKVSDIFKTVEESNNIVAGMSSDTLNLDLKDDVNPIDDVNEGAYTFVFYHMIDGARESDFMAKIDVKGTVYPLFAGGDRRCRQEGINFFTFRLRGPITTDILQSYRMVVLNRRNVDISHYFQSITKSNPWEEDDISPSAGGAVKDVTEFDLKLKGKALTGLPETLKIIGDSLRFDMINANGFRMDSCCFDVNYAEGIMYELDGEEGFKQVSLDTLRLKFQEEQNKKEFAELIVTFEQIMSLDKDGNPDKVVDRSGLFKNTAHALSLIEEDYFETVELSLQKGKMLPRNADYGYLFSMSYNAFEKSTIRQVVYLDTPMTTERPTIHTVSAVEDDKLGRGIVVAFSPWLAKELYDSESMTVHFTPKGNSDDDLIENHVFLGPMQWHVEIQMDDNGGDPTDTADDIEYIEYIMMPFNEEKVLNRANYVMEFRWAEPAFMSALDIRKEFKLDYILKPVEKIEITGIGEIEVTFKLPLKQSYLLDCQVEVLYIVQEENEDEIVTSECDLSNLFEPLTTTNALDFPVDEETGDPITDIDPLWKSAKLKLRPETEIPSGNYSIRIGHLEGAENDNPNELIRVYAGSIKIPFLQNLTTTVNAIYQSAIDFVTVHLSAYRNVDMLSSLSVTVKGMSDGVDYSGYFSSIHASNEYEKEVTNENGEVTKEVAYYRDTMEAGILIDGKNIDVIDGVHTLIQSAKTFRLYLAEGKAIPPGSYGFTLKYNNTEYGNCSSDLTFMTTTPPNISGMQIKDRCLLIDWLPHGESKSMNASHFTIMTNRGFNANGDVIGEDKSSLFGPISSATFDMQPQGSIEYIRSASIPVNPDASMPAGTYTLIWEWAKNSFMEKIMYTGALNVISLGIKSAMLSDEETIHVILETAKKWSYLKNLEISVVNSKGEDYTDSFQTMEESNTSLTDDNADVTEFDIKLEDGEDVCGGTYTFSLQSTIRDDSGNTILTPDYEFSMTIVFMTTEFGELKKVDNLSADDFELIELKNNKDDKATYIGKHAGLVLEGGREILSEENFLKYCGKTKYGPPNAKIYADARIDELTFEFDDDVYPELLTACTLSIVSENGSSVVDDFETIQNSNVFKKRKVVDKIEFTINGKAYDAETLESFRVEGTFVNGDNIDDASANNNTETAAGGTEVEQRTPTFQTIEKSNDFPETEDGNPPFTTNVFMVDVDDGDIEEYESYLLLMTVKDSQGNPLPEKVTYKFIMTEVETVRKCKLKLKEGKTLVPGTYSITLSYVNEPGLEGAVTIEAYAAEAELPFLSTDPGKIAQMFVSGLYTIKMELTANLPCSVFQSIEMHVYDEDGVDRASVFKDIASSMNFGGATYISDLEEPNQVYFELLEGETLDAGNYTFTFDIQLKSQEDDSDTSAPITYNLWSRTMMLPYMERASAVVISNVEQAGIDMLKISLQNPVNVNLIRKFHVAVLNEGKEELFTDSFQSLTNSNNFGLGIMMTERQHIMYQEGSSGWNQVDTGIGKQFNDIIYVDDSKKYVLACGSSLVVSKEPRDRASFSEVYKGDITISCLLYVKPFIIGFLYDGCILKYNDKTGEHTIDKTFKGENSITNAILHKDSNGNTVILAIGLKGAMIQSTNGGNSWEKKETGYSKNLTGIAYYDSYTKEDEPVTPENAGWYISTSSGHILYSKDGTTWTKLSTGIAGSLQDIYVHEEKILACGDLGTIIVSEDGVKWAKSETSVNTILKTICFIDNQYIVAGSNGNYLTSKSGYTWTANKNIRNYNFNKLLAVANQYENKNAGSHFYVKLKRGEIIGNHSIFTGTDEDPNEPDTISSKWFTDDAKKAHIGDLYYSLSVENGLEVRSSRWQYAKTEDGFKWVQSETNDLSEIPPLGSYTIYLTRDFTDDINISTVDDDKKLDGREIVTYKTGVGLAYMTSNPGNIHVPTTESTDKCTPVSIVSPDKEIEDRMLDAPYLQIMFDMGDELAMQYSSYTILDGSTDITEYFYPIHKGIVIYGRSSYVSKIILPIVEKHLKDIKYSNNIQLQWNWTRFNDADIDISTNNIFKKPLLGVSITRPADTIDKLSVKFTQEFPQNFLTNKSDRAKPIIKPHLYAIDKKSVYSTIKDYIDEFDTVGTFDMDGSSKISGFTMEITEGGNIPSGDYLFVLNTASTEKDSTLESETSFIYTTIKQELKIGIQESYPEITSVYLQMYENKVEPIVDDATNAQHTDHGDPSMEDARTLLWLQQGEDECRKHVGDIYVNSDDPDKRFSWAYLEEEGRFFWKALEQTAHLKINMLPFPSRNAVEQEIDRIVLTDRVTENGSEKDVDLSNYFSKDINEWDLEFNGNTRDSVSAMYIPFAVPAWFPGTQNGKLEIFWKSDSLYHTMLFPAKWPNPDSKLQLQERAIDYGTISFVEGYILPPYLTMDENGQEVHQEGEAGIIIHLTNALSTSWLSALEFSMIKDVDGTDYTEDIANCFKSIRESNLFWFDESSPTVKSNTIRLTLLPGMEIESRVYRAIKLFGAKSKADVETTYDTTDVVTLMIENVQLSYITGAPPEDMSVTLGSHPDFAVPALTIQFLDNLPDVAAVLSYTLSVIKTEDGKDYSDCFCASNEISVASNRGFSYVSEIDSGIVKVRSVTIPMKDARVLMNGNYEVKFYFSSTSKLTYVNLFDKIRKFTISGGAVITPLGSVIKTETEKRNTICKIHVKFDPSLATLADLKSSQIGTSLNITSYASLFKKLTLSFKGGKKSKDYASFFRGFMGCEDGGGGTVIYKTKVKSNKKVNPGNVKVSFTMSGSAAFRETECEFKGVILNKVGKATKDKICYIVKETRGGKTLRKVYKTYAKAKKRINRLKKLNSAETKHYKMCKKCRKIKLLTTSKIKAQIEKLLVKDGNAANAIYQAAEGYYFDIMAPKLNCDKVQLSQEESSTDGYSHIGCENYVSKNLQYTWEFKIATTPSFPGKRAKSKRMYFYYIVKNGVQLDRGFKASNKGKKTKTCKKYGKSLGTHIKNYKKKVSRCRKCKKRAMAKKSSSAIGWGAALFPDALRTHKSGKFQGKITKYFNKFYKNGKKMIKVAGKKKKKKNPLYCTKHKFKLVKKDNKYCRLSCSNVANADKTLEYGCYKATFKK